MADDQPSISIGGSNYGNVAGRDVNLAPKPEASGYERFKNQPDAGKYVTQIEIKVSAPYEARALRVEARGASISDLSIFPPLGGVLMTAEGPEVGVTPARACQIVLAPLAGVYHATATTMQPDEIAWNVVVGI